VSRPSLLDTPALPAELRRASQPSPSRLDGVAPGRQLVGLPAWAQLVPILALAAAVRVWQLGSVGFNSDEAVYSGQAASIADHSELEELFPIFRAHPLLFQTLLSVGFRLQLGEGFQRLTVALMGVVTVYLVYDLGRLLYGRRAGVLAALLMALMPYHVVVTRQVLLDGPMTLFATLTLLLLVRYVLSGRSPWLYAAGGAMGLTFLSKETSVLLLGAIFAFFALTPELRVRVRDLAISIAVMALVVAPLPLSLMLAGRTGTGENYLVWQLFRRPNHDWLFYPATVTDAIGPLLLVVALAGLWLLRREGSWRETLLLCWVLVPTVFFQLWPVKGYQYLLPIAPPLALLAGRALSRHVSQERALGLLATAIVAVSLLIPTLGRVTDSTLDTFMAGSGGLPAGREAGEWVDASVPRGATFMTIGPSMANLIQYYGHRKAYGLSVSPNPLNRNPSYEPLTNPDRALRDNEIQYIVWDAFSADRSRHFSQQLLRYADRYDARVVHTEVLPAPTVRGKTAERPAIVIYEVGP